MPEGELKVRSATGAARTARLSKERIAPYSVLREFLKRPGGSKGGRDGSLRQGGWNEVVVDFRRHDCGPKFFGLAAAKRSLHVEIKEGVKEDESEKRHESAKRSLAAAGTCACGSVATHTQSLVWSSSLLSS